VQRGGEVCYLWLPCLYSSTTTVKYRTAALHQAGAEKNVRIVGINCRFWTISVSGFRHLYLYCGSIMWRVYTLHQIWCLNDEISDWYNVDVRWSWNVSGWRASVAMIDPLHCKKYPYIDRYFVASFPSELVPYTIVSVNRRNNEAAGPRCNVGPRFIFFRLMNDNFRLFITSITSASVI